MLLTNSFQGVVNRLSSGHLAGLEVTALLLPDCANLANKPVDLSGPQHLHMGKGHQAGRSDGPMNSKSRFLGVSDVELPY